MQPLQSAYTTPVSGQFPTTHHIPNWYSIGDVRRLKIIREIIESYGKDPRISGQAVQILRGSGIEPRNYMGQAQALLEWTQQQIYYVNEPGERLQAPLATLRMGYGDCDDMVILLCSFFESIRLPWKLSLAGKDKRTGKLVQYVEGTRLPPGVQWTHIYCIVGDHPFSAKRWFSAEPTLQVPLGWDVVKATNTQHTHASPRIGRSIARGNGGRSSGRNDWSSGGDGQKRVDSNSTCGSDRRIRGRSLRTFYWNWCVQPTCTWIGKTLIRQRERR